MSYEHPAYRAARQARFLRTDAHRWIRPDAAKFLKPGTDPADVYPALAQRRARRAAEEKYSPSQLRVPAGQTGGGQWTSGASGGGRPRVVIDTTDFGGEQTGDDTGVGSVDRGFDGADSNPGFDDPGESIDNGDLAFDAPGEHVDLGSGIGDRAPARDRSQGITDTRVISDADPEGVRPAEQYAQLQSIPDANGNPYYAPKGHHELPQQIYKDWDLQPETRRVFDSATTGRLPGGTTVRTSPDGIPLGHGWTTAHREYNETVGELSEDFLKRNALTPREMSPPQAEQLLGEIRSSQDPRIRDFNRAMRMLNRVFRFRSGRSE